MMPKPIPIASTSVFLSLLAAGMAATLHVGPAGSDANDGRSPERALRTIQAAVDRIQPGDTVLVQSGIYREAVVLSKGGTPSAPVTIQADGDVVVTGCEPVAGWRLHDAARGIWAAPMPWTLGVGRNQVFTAGQVLIEARHPNEPAADLGMYVADLSPLWPTFGEFSIPDPKDNPGRVVSPLLEGVPDDHWKGACYHGVHYQGWSAQTGVVESSKSGEIQVGERTRTWWFTGPYGAGYKPEEGRGMLVGHMNALDHPGEWHWQDGILYLIPPVSGEPRAIEAKARQLAFDLSGQAHVRLRGLRVHAASLRLDGSVGCVVDDCHLAYISHYTRHDGIGQIEPGRDTLKSGETGIFVGGRGNAFLNCSVRFSAGAGFYLRGYGHTIHNCLIDEISMVGHYLNAITDAVADFLDYEDFLVGGHTITYNTMRNAGRHFFNFYGNGTSTASRHRGPMDIMATLFAHNHLYNGMLLTRDAGFLTGYYGSGGTLNGLHAQVAYNVMHDCYDIFGMRINKLGIVYLDAGTCHVDLHHNLLWAAPGSHQRGLWYNTMCVGVTERHNVFHPGFTRTPQELTPEDFPAGQPFRFGHDFTAPPPLPRWPQLDSLPLAVTGAAPGVTVSDTGAAVLRGGDWLALGEVDGDTGWQSGVLRFAGNRSDLNSNRASRSRPRHARATDPLVFEAVHNDGMEDRIRTQWTFIHAVNDGAWIRFNQVPLGDGYHRFRAVYGNCSAAPRHLELRLDGVDGPLAGRVALPPTDKDRDGRIQIYGEAVAEVQPEATGTRDVFLIFRSDDGLPVGEFEYFRLERYRGDIPLQPQEVRIDLRAGSPAGETVAVFYPRATGGDAVVRDLVAGLEPLAGRQALFAVVRAAVDGSVGEFHGLRLERAKHPIDWSGVGTAPRLDADGRPVFPAVTHRPQARPADKYPSRDATAPARPRPILAARLLTGPPPDLDGRTEPWETVATPAVLRESWDGTPSAAPPSTVWVAYDQAALYVAARHPVRPGSALTVAGHTWGATDAMEIALQAAFAAPGAPILNLYGWPDGHVVSTSEAGAPAAVAARLGEAVTYKAAIGEDGWSGVWRIPFSACGFSPDTAALLHVNFGVRKLADDAWVIWRGTGAATHLVGKAGLLVFPEALAAAAVPPPPRDGLLVWLDAADAATVEVDADGRVVCWRDKSGADRNAVQANPACRPAYELQGLNGRPALRFREEARTRLELADLAEARIDATVFAVFSNPVPGAPVNHDPRLFTASDGMGYDYQVGICASVPGMTVGGPRQGLFTFSDRWARTVRVGCFSPQPQTFLQGHIAEVLVYGRHLPEAERELVRATLAVKWGLLE